MLLAGFLLALTANQPTQAASAKAQSIIQNPPLKIGLLTTSTSDACYNTGVAAAIKRLATLERDRVNATTGIAGRRLELVFFDDLGDAQNTVANVRSAMADGQMVAMVGLTNSNRAKAVFDGAGQEVLAAGLPWLSNISVNDLFEKYPNVFTMRGALEDDSIPVMARFIKDLKVSRPAFIGIKDNIMSTTIAEGLKQRLGPLGFVADYRVPLRDDKLDPADIQTLITGLKTANPDFLVLSIGGSNRMGSMLTAMDKADIHLPLFVSGRLETIFASGNVSYSGDLYQLAWDGLPDADNDRVRKFLFRSTAGEMIFGGERNPKASGWTNGQCKDSQQEEPSVLSNANLRAVGFGLQYADMIAMIADTLRSSAPTTNLGVLRKTIIDGYQKTYASGHGAFPGALENWSFRPSSRAAARTPFIIMHPKGLGADQLAPIQYVTLRNDALRQIQTLYLDVDLTRAFRIDDKEKSFVAEFYLSMHAQGDQSIEQIEFANAFLDPDTNSKQITIRPLHEGGPSSTYPSDMKIYAVSGKFMFNPNFGNYPFDSQRFSIDLRSKSGDAPFIIQPSPKLLRDQIVDADGWRLREQYVGYDEDFLPVIDARSHERSIVPFYKGSFVWVMKREATDYFLTVVIPLAFIMIIAYLAIFIPGSHFEAIVTIQVTALLSAVALYLTIPKIGSDEATISDKMFLFDYLLISLMIGISILRVNRTIDKAPRLDMALGVVHIFVIPILVVIMALYVIGASQSDGQTASAFLPAMREAVWR